jgi:hypothetical protein
MARDAYPLPRQDAPAWQHVDTEPELQAVSFTATSLSGKKHKRESALVPCTNSPRSRWKSGQEYAMMSTRGRSEDCDIQLKSQGRKMATCVGEQAETFKFKFKFKLKDQDHLNRSAPCLVINRQVVHTQPTPFKQMATSSARPTSWTVIPLQKEPHFFAPPF